MGAPIVYQGSHVLPDGEKHPRAGYLSLGEIPSFIEGDGRSLGDEAEANESCWPYLRVMLRGDNRFRTDYVDTVVLDGVQVAYLRDQLNVWLTRAQVEGYHDDDVSWVELEADRRKKWGEDE